MVPTGRSGAWWRERMEKAPEVCKLQITPGPSPSTWFVSPEWIWTEHGFQPSHWHSTSLKTANNTGVKALKIRIPNNIFFKCAIYYLLSVYWNSWRELSARSQPQCTLGAEWTKTSKVSQKKKQNKPNKNSFPNPSASSICMQAESCINLPWSCPLYKHLPAQVSS